MDFIFAVTALELVGRLPFTKAKLRFTMTEITLIFFILIVRVDLIPPARF